jgi:hypothetical protein
MTFDAKQIKFRASGVHHIMTSLETITEKQLITLAELAAKEKRTPLQNETMMQLIAKRDAPDELPPGAITHLWDIYDSFMYGIKEDICGKEIDKGNLCEQDVLGLLSSALGMFIPKNEKQLENNWIKGKPDAIIFDVVPDTKASWNLRTFRKAEMIPAYEWQLHSYMFLTGAKKGLLAYGLVDTPEELIQDEIRRQTYYRGIIDDTSSEAAKIEKQIRLNMTFSDRIPAKNRLKLFWIDRDEKKIDQIKRRVEMCWTKLEEMHRIETDYLPEILK